MNGGVLQLSKTLVVKAGCKYQGMKFVDKAMVVRPLRNIITVDHRLNEHGLLCLCTGHYLTLCSVNEAKPNASTQHPYALKDG